MNIDFKNDISSNYMVLENISDFSQDDFSYKMISENEIKGLLKFDYELINGNINLIYDITGKESLGKKYNVKKMNFDELKNLIFSINSVLSTAKEYLLDPNDILLKKECIFLSGESKNVEFCYFPNYKGNFLLEIRELTAQMLSFIDYGDQKAVRLAYFIQRQSQEDNFTIEGVINSFGKIMFDEKIYLMNESIVKEPSFEEEYAADHRSIRTENSFRKNTGTGIKFEQLEKQEKNLVPEVKDGFLQKASVYFKITKPSEIYDDFNHLKMLKKIKNTSADLAAAKAEQLKKLEEANENPNLKKSKHKKEVEIKSSDKDERPKEMFEIWN